MTDLRTLFRGGPVRTLGAGGDPDWVLVDGDVISYTGTGEEPPADRVINLHGACLLPAFCDAHVHLGATGLRHTAADLRGLEDPRGVLDAMTGKTLGIDLEEGELGFPDRRELDVAVGNHPALVARADLHSCLVSTALLGRLDLGDVEGVERNALGLPTGVLKERAAALAWRAYEEDLSSDQMAAGVRGVMRDALEKGVACVHEMFVVEWRNLSALDYLLVTIDEEPLLVEIYVGTDDVAAVTERGLSRIGGDWFLDGTLGSRTAWLTDPYSGSDETGMAYRSLDELTEWCRRAANAGLSTGVHAIGDAAIDQALSAWEQVASEVGVDRIRAGGHRIEHFEMATDELVARTAALGIAVCVQPGFDGRWGGPHRMYSDRLGPERASLMNRFATMERAGVKVGLGSDAPITPLDPWAQAADWMEHSQPAERVDATTALRAHASASWSLGGSDAGIIETGRPAHLIVADRDPLGATAIALRSTEVLATWIDGRRVYP